MDPFNDIAMDGIGPQRLESGLAQIEANMARKQEEKRKERELNRDSGEENKHTGRSDQIGQNEENDIASHCPEKRARSKEEKEANRLYREKTAAKARSRGDGALESKKSKDARKRDKSKKRHRSHKDRKALKETSSKLANDINDHAEDISSILDDDTPTETMTDSAKASTGVFSPMKETRIVPVKVGGFWQFPTVGNRQAKPEESPRDTNTPPRRSNTLLGKRGPSSSPETDSEDNMVRKKRVKMTSNDEEIITPTTASRVKLAGSLNTRVGKTLALQGRDTGDQQNEEQSPSSMSTTSSASSSSSLSTAWLSEVFQKYVGRREHAVGDDGVTANDTPKAVYETVPDAWQDRPGKVRGRLQTSEDTEMEESKHGDPTAPHPWIGPLIHYLLTAFITDLAFSSRYIATHANGVTISGMNFKTVALAPDTQFVFEATKDARLRIVSVAQGTVEVMMCRKAFTVEMGGMWRLRVGERCSMTPRGVEAVALHVTSIKHD